MEARPDLLFVHGAWHGAWAWDRVLQVLEATTWSAAAIDLPGHGASAQMLTDLHGDADAVLDAVEASGRPTVLVGHSYGGMVITDAGIHDLVVGLVYVAAFLPDVGESLVDAQRSVASMGGRPDRSGLEVCIRTSHDGELSRLGGDRLGEILYHDCQPERRRDAERRLGPHRVDAFTQVPRSFAWRSKPTSYVVCTQDLALDMRLQRRMARRAGRVLELPSSHSPFLSMPTQLASAVTAVVPEEPR